MKTWYRVGFLLLITAALIGVIWGIEGGPASAESSAPEQAQAAQPLNTNTVSIQPPARTVGLGEQFTITVEITDLVTPLSAFQFDLNYDPALIEPSRTVPASFLSSTGRMTICPELASPSAGVARFACVGAGQESGPTGSGSLTTLTFLALDVGTSPLTLSAIQLAGAGLPPASIAATAQPGEVTVRPSPAVVLGNDQTGMGEVLTQMVYSLTVVNTGDYTDTFLLSVDGASWTSMLSSETTGPLSPGYDYPFSLTVSIPDVNNGSQDVATVTAISSLDPGVSASIHVTTTAIRSGHEIYLPIVLKSSQGR